MGQSTMGAKRLMGRFHPLKCCHEALWRGKEGEERARRLVAGAGGWLFDFPKGKKEKRVLVFVASFLDRIPICY